MNIVKFQDIVLTPEYIEEHSIPVSSDMCELFNTKFKAKYVHCINWTYCISFDDLSIDKVVALSQDPSTIESLPYFLYNDVISLIDTKETGKINKIDKYIQANTFTPDSDITEEELRRFRTWVAENLYNIVPDLDDDTKHMLEYYMNEKSDDVTKYLAVFGNASTTILSTTTTSTCGCSQVSSSVIASTIGSSTTKPTCGCSTDLSGLYSKTLTTCDPLFIYTKNIYALMVSTFSNIDFWLNTSEPFVTEMKKYVDNIIKKGFALGSTQYQTDFAECGCLSDSDALQKKQLQRLHNLSESLEYIIGELDTSDDTPGISQHKNFITNSLNEWAVNLYEVMRW